MIVLPDAREHERVVAAVRDAGAEAGGYPIRLGLLADNEDLSQRLQDGEWGQTEVPLTLDATLAGSLPRRLQDADTRLVCEVAGVPVEQLRGVKTALLPGQDAYSTDLLTSSPGSLLAGEDAITLDAPTDYPGHAPERVVLDVARRLPYDPSRVDIEPVPGVVLDLVGASATPGFAASETTGDVLSRLAALRTVGYRYADTARRGFRAWVPRPLGAPERDPSGFRSYTADLLPSWSVQRPRPPAERWSAVRVYGVSPRSGRTVWEVTEEVPYPPDVRVPHRGRTQHIPVEDPTEEGAARGRDLALLRTLEIARQTSAGEELTLPAFDPLVEAHDGFSVTEDHRDDDGLWEIAWSMRVETFKHAFGVGEGGSGGEGSGGAGGTLRTSVGYTATLLFEDRVAAPTLVLGGAAGARAGVVATPRPSYGLAGLAPPATDEIYFDEPLPWVAAEGDDLVFAAQMDGNPRVFVDPANPDELVVIE